MANVTVQKDRYTVDPLYQWDLNQVLEIRGLSLPSIPEIHFTNEAMDRAIVRHANTDAAGVITVDVPNSLLQKPYKVKAYVCLYEGDTFETLYLIEIPVKARKKPIDYTLEDTDGEIYSFNALENAVVNSLAEIQRLRDDVTTVYDATKRSIANEGAAALSQMSESGTSLLNSITTEGNRALSSLLETRNEAKDELNAARDAALEKLENYEPFYSDPTAHTLPVTSTYAGDSGGYVNLSESDVKFWKQAGWIFMSGRIVGIPDREADPAFFEIHLDTTGEFIPPPQDIIFAGMLYGTRADGTGEDLGMSQMQLDKNGTFFFTTRPYSIDDYAKFAFRLTLSYPTFE